MIVNWTARATANLDAVEAHIAKSSPRTAREVALRVARKTAILADFPLFGAIVAEYDDDDLRELYEHPYRIFYRVHPDRVDIVGVTHSARQLPRGL